MSQRYIYDEVKKEFEEIGAELKPATIIIAMRNVTHNYYKRKAPGEIPEDKFDEFKEKVIMRIVETQFLYRKQLKILKAITKKGPW